MSTGKNGERFVWLVMLIPRGAYRANEGKVIGAFESSESAIAVCEEKNKRALYAQYIVQRKTVKP